MVAASPAAAHPHVFIDNRVTFVFDAGKVTALRLHWVFDDVFSDTLLMQHDADGDGAFDELESRALGEASCPTSSSSTISHTSGSQGRRLTRSIPPASWRARRMAS